MTNPFIEFTNQMKKNPVSFNIIEFVHNETQYVITCRTNPYDKEYPFVIRFFNEETGYADSIHRAKEIDNRRTFEIMDDDKNFGVCGMQFTFPREVIN